MAAQQREPQQGSQQQQERPQRTHVLFCRWLILIMVLVWGVVSAWGMPGPGAAIPYTTFLAQVRADNVTNVRIVGDEINGSFEKPFLWSRPVPDTPFSTSPQTYTPLPIGKPADQLSPVPNTYTKFHTTFPQAIGDATLLPLLEAHHVVIDVASPSSPWFIAILASLFPVLFLVGLFAWMSRPSTRSQSSAFGFGQTKARRYTSHRPQVAFNDIASADAAKAALQQEVEFLRHPQKYHDLGARLPRGVLLVGPPGTGKTLLARAVAGEAGVPFFSISGSEFVEMFVGVGASRVRSLFEQAKATAPAIIFVDELDAVGRRRRSGLGTVNDEREQTLNQLLVEMDGFDERREVIILAATNRPDVLDPALLRPGRFDRQVMVELPDRRGREAILHIHTRKLRLAPDVDLLLIARTTTGMSGADLANLCNEAALIAAQHDHVEVAMTDFKDALDKIILGEVRSLVLSDQDRRVVAYHESGHALVAWLTSAADPVHRVTIIPHGRALGVTEQQPQEEHSNYNRTYLLARLGVMLGGRTAEEVALGNITTGAENDLVEATRLARRMVTRWGMGSLGPVAFRADEQQPFLGYELSQSRDYSEATAARIDEEVRQLLEERHAAVRRLLTGARAQLDRLVEVLLQEETIDQEELVRILGPRPAKTGELLAD